MHMCTWLSHDYSDDPKKSSKDKKKKKRGKKGRGGNNDDEVAVSRPSVIVGDGEMPDGAVTSDEDNDSSRKAGASASGLDALDQNLDMWDI